MQRIKMSNNMQRFKIIRKDINQISEGKSPCRNMIRIEIPIGQTKTVGYARARSRAGIDCGA
jgi:hypothetical protein